MRIELREARPDDPAMLRLAEALRDEVEARGAHNGEARPDISLAEAVKADSQTLVAYCGQRPVGIGALRPFGPGIVEIKRMYVDPRHRGSGVASRLLEELEGRARRLGFEVVRLDTNDRLTEATAFTTGPGTTRSRTTTRIRGRTAGTRSLSPEFP